MRLQRKNGAVDWGASTTERMSSTEEKLATVLPALLKRQPVNGKQEWAAFQKMKDSRDGQGHQHPINRFCHTLGIPLIVLSLALFVLAVFVRGLWPVALALFVVGWAFQFIGHAVEGKPPEFFHDWRFLFVGLRWWGQDPWASVSVRAGAEGRGYRRQC
jgi:hypothetical protein